MKAARLRVSLNFGRGVHSTVLEVSGSVIANLYGNPSYPAPPVDKADLEAALAAYIAALAAQVQGGTAATAWKNRCREELIGLLRILAFHVQVVAGRDPAKFLSSGFPAVKQGNSQSQLPMPAIQRLKRGLSGQMLVTVGRIANTRAYQVESALLDEDRTPGPWLEAGCFTRSRGIPVGRLVPGRIYQFRVRAIGGSTGFSDWSASVSQRVM